MEFHTVARHLGAQRKGHVASMVTALSLHSWRNTAEENARLAAGVYALRNWRAYQWYLAAQREARTRKAFSEVR